MSSTDHDFFFFDLARSRRSSGIDLLFPGWKSGDERVVIFSPHDDDGLLGAGLLILAASRFKARVKIVVFCDGRAGYSRIEEKVDIVERRKEETRKAYARLGLAAADIVHLDIPDFSALHYLGLALPDGRPGLFARIVPLLRSERVTRLIIPNGFREHIDHTAVHDAGRFFGPQVGDAVAGEFGEAGPLRSTLVYAVWGDFPPDQCLLQGRDASIRADRAITAPAAAEHELMSALREFASQEQVIANLIEARKQRIRGARCLELYMSFEPRPALALDPYWRVIEGLV